MTDRYTKAVLTVIAIALVWIALQQTVRSVQAAGFFNLSQVSHDAARCLAGYSKGVEHFKSSCYGRAP